MTLRLLLPALAAILFTAALRADSPIVLRGVLVLGDSRVFSLATEGGAQTAWVSIGETFAGHELVSFDQDENKLLLRADGVEKTIHLASSATRPEKTGKISEAAELIQSMRFEEMMKKTIEQQQKAMADMTRQMLGDQANEEMIAMQKRAMEAFNEAMDWEGFQEDMTRVYEETFSGEEIQGLLDFYSTPAGRAYVDKQPELARRTMEVMQPRIMRAMPQMHRALTSPPAAESDRP